MPAGSNAEDQLTEVFAAVLAADTEFAGRVLDLMQLPGNQARVVQTQMPTGVGRRTMDMNLQLVPTGTTLGEVWCEHKMDAPFGDGQLDDYELALARARTAGAAVHFVVITLRDISRVEHEQIARMGGIRLMWPDVAGALERLLSERDPAGTQMRPAQKLRSDYVCWRSWLCIYKNSRRSRLWSHSMRTSSPHCVSSTRRSIRRRNSSAM